MNFEVHFSITSSMKSSLSYLILVFCSLISCIFSSAPLFQVRTLLAEFWLNPLLLCILHKALLSALCKRANQKNGNGVEETGRSAEMVLNSAGQSQVVT